MVVNIFVYFVVFTSFKLNMAKPVRKAIRLFPCYCSSCSGKVCDIRTVQMHMKYFTVDDTIQFNNLEDTASDIQEELLDESADQENDEDDVIDEFSLKEIDDDGVNDSSLIQDEAEYSVDQSSLKEVDVCSRHNIEVNEKQLTEFVLKEVKCKLEHGNSQAEIEEHLQNAAKINTTKMA